MCELFSIAAGTFGASQTAAISVTVLDAVSLIGTVASMGSSYSQAEVTRDQYAYQAQIERNKAAIRERQAKDVIKRGEDDARARKAYARTLEDKQLVTLAGQGGDVTAEGDVNLLAETAEYEKLQEQKIRNNAQRDASAIRADASNKMADATASQYASGAISPLAQTVPTALSGFGAGGEKWYKKGWA